MGQLDYAPTWRDNARYTLGQMLGGGYGARDFAKRLVGSPSNVGLADFVPVVGSAFGAQEGAQTFNRGYKTGSAGIMAAGALGMGLSVLPEVGIAASLARKPAVRAAGRAFAMDERGALNFKPGGEYKGGHIAPVRDGGAPLHNLAGDVYPKDIYSPQAARYYGTGSQDDAKTMTMLQSYLGKPNAVVPIYRAVPKGVKDINAEDWVALDKKYAQQHGDSALGGSYDILSEKVKAKDLFTSGDSIYEWGWSPKPQALTPPQQQAQGVLDLLKSGRPFSRDERGSTALFDKASEAAKHLREKYGKNAVEISNHPTPWGNSSYISVKVSDGTGGYAKSGFRLSDHPTGESRKSTDEFQTIIDGGDVDANSLANIVQNDLNVGLTRLAISAPKREANKRAIEAWKNLPYKDRKKLIKKALRNPQAGGAEATAKKVFVENYSLAPRQQPAQGVGGIMVPPSLIKRRGPK